ncbi:MAG TPA: hypothetical protein VFK43_03990, partial [Acidimicrobiales bacterium]|nr:hypothetical protein [Acidimicrobiales bacterium]
MGDDRIAHNRLHRLLPAGIPLGDQAWMRRHRVIVALLWAHVVALPVYSWWEGHGITHGLFEVLAIAACALAATRGGVQHRRLSGLAAVIGLLLSSATLVHLSGGLIEMHFHFFVMVGVITLYQEWLTFLAAIVFVALHHGVIGALAPRDVFNHESAWASP